LAVSCRVLRFVRVVRVAGQSRSMTSSLYASLQTTRTSRSWQVSWKLLMGIPATAIPAAHLIPFFSRSLWWRPRSRPRAHQRRHILPVCQHLWSVGASALGLGPAISDAPLTQPHAHTPTYPHRTYDKHHTASCRTTRPGPICWSTQSSTPTTTSAGGPPRSWTSATVRTTCESRSARFASRVCVWCLMTAGDHTARMGSNALRATTAQNEPASAGRGPYGQGEPPQVPYHAVRLRHEPGPAGTPIHRNAGMVCRVSCHACVRVCVCD
jgi:hypothetical protein